VAVRDADNSAMTWHPPSVALARWLQLYREVARSGGGEPDVGRRLSWRKAGAVGGSSPTPGSPSSMARFSAAADCLAGQPAIRPTEHLQVS
jgi:hypothetical protein